MDLAFIGYGALVILGFSFIVFIHEMGHFLAAKWAGVKVEQFAIGFGHAILSWRKGMAPRIGSSEPQLKKMKLAGEDISNYGETEYRINWIPLGGYVKMLGQDDMDPTAQSKDPRSYNNAPVGKRMVIISAGVIMNVILAFLLFTGLFLYGFESPPAMAGQVRANSPAQQAGIETGDRLKSFNGEKLYDFNRIMLHVSLSRPEPRELVYERFIDGAWVEKRTYVTPQKIDAGGRLKGILAIGVEAPYKLRAIEDFRLNEGAVPHPQSLMLKPGDTVIEVDGTAIKDIANDIAVYDHAVQSGKPFAIKVRGADGQERTFQAQPTFTPPFGGDDFNLAGLQPRVTVRSLLPDSSAKDKLMPGDVVIEVDDGKAITRNPDGATLRSILSKVGQDESKVDLLVQREGVAEPVAVKGLEPTVLVDRDTGRKGLGIGLGYDFKPMAAAIVKGSAMDKAGVSKDDVITAVNGASINGLRELHVALRSLQQGEVKLTVKSKDDERDVTLTMDQATREELSGLRYTTHFQPFLQPQLAVRLAEGPGQASYWGVIETRDFLLQVYVMLQRMIEGHVPLSSVSGPVGIFQMGSRVVANRGLPWFIWFLALLSANLAVVNFLPLPVVDGGHFVLLIIEKISGKPVPMKAQAIIQYVGLVLLLSVFVLVTFNDIVHWN